MKKNVISLITIVSLLVIGCEREKDVKPIVSDSGDIVFGISGSKTRAVVADEHESGVIIPLGSDDSGHSFFLEETISYPEVGQTDIATRGTPAYTENVAALYGKFNSVAYSNGSKIYGDGNFSYEGPFWARHFHKDPWKDSGNNDIDELYFFMNMPTGASGVGTLSYEFVGEKGKISFDYESPATATAQEDILFAGRGIRKSDYETKVEAGSAPDVLFHHALTGVKFAIGNDNSTLEEGTKTYITKVVFNGLKSKGHCVVTPREETNGYVDDKTGDYSSGDGETVVWTSLEGDGEFSQEFTSGDGAGNIVDYDKDSGSGKNKFGDSFYSAANTKNLNDADGTMTFWFIPQELTSDVTLTVTFHVQVGSSRGEDITRTIKFGEELNSRYNTNAGTTGKAVEWMAGQLRTYTLKPDVVDIEIVDEMDEDKYEKSNVIITNTGNVKEYVRVNIIGNWVGKIAGSSEYTILNGYTTETGDDEVVLWNDKETEADGGTKYGTFEDLPAKSTSTSNPSPIHNWVRFDKYYYYTNAIGAGDAVPSTDPIFTKYTIGSSPAFWIADVFGTRHEAEDVHFVMDIVVQSIAVPVDVDGNDVDYRKAWADALGLSSVDKLLDL